MDAGTIRVAEILRLLPGREGTTMKALTKIPKEAVFALYLSADGKALVIEDLENVSREIRQVSILSKRPPDTSNRIVSFRVGGGTVPQRMCCIPGKCWPCYLVEYLFLLILAWFINLFK